MELGSEKGTSSVVDTSLLIVHRRRNLTGAGGLRNNLLTLTISDKRCLYFLLYCLATLLKLRLWVLR